MGSGPARPVKPVAWSLRRATQPLWTRAIMRTATIQRDTAETKIAVTLDLDGTGAYDVETGVGFFDHMLDAFARPSAVSSQWAGPFTHTHATQTFARQPASQPASPVT